MRLFLLCMAIAVCVGANAQPNAPDRPMDWKKLAVTAKEQLTSAKKKDWNYGNVIHNANQILGMAALVDGDRKAAKKYLIEAGKSPGSPQLNKDGPRMILAQALLDRGEKAVVLQYLDLVAKFYVQPKHPTYGSLAKEHRAQIAKWKADIKAGKKVTLPGSHVPRSTLPPPK